jgi:hydroxymethylpyrimidine pyrophosphatase-like HAD family hydrolase
MDPRVDKGSALRKYCTHAGITPAEVIACGDMENDIGMMKAAGLGVCLLNGSEAARSAADNVTDYPVAEDGLGRWFFKTIFSEDKEF